MSKLPVFENMKLPPGFEGFDEVRAQVAPDPPERIAWEQLSRGDSFTLGGEQRWVVIKRLHSGHVWVIKTQQIGKSRSRRKNYEAHRFSPDTPWRIIVREVGKPTARTEGDLIGPTLDEGYVQDTIKGHVDLDWNEERFATEPAQPDPKEAWAYSVGLAWSSDERGEGALVEAAKAVVGRKKSLLDAFLRGLRAGRGQENPRTEKSHRTKSTQENVDVASWLLETGAAHLVGEFLGIDWSRSAFPVEQFARGIVVELEHGPVDPQTDVTTGDLTETAKIALAHLNELPDYYDRLERMERGECNPEAVLTFDMDEIEEDPWRFAADQGVHVLSHLEWYAGFVDDEGIVAALFVGVSGDDYEFDIAVAPRARQQGLASKLMDLAIENYEELREPFPDLVFSLDVINPVSRQMLEQRGFTVVGGTNDRPLMSRNPAPRFHVMEHTPLGKVSRTLSTEHKTLKSAISRAKRLLQENTGLFLGVYETEWDGESYYPVAPVLWKGSSRIEPVEADSPEALAVMSYWIDPYGTIYPVPTYAHAVIAAALITQGEFSGGECPSDEAALRAGWLQVSVEPGSAPTFNYRNDEPTQRQLDAVFDLAVAHNTVEASYTHPLWAEEAMRWIGEPSVTRNPAPVPNPSDLGWLEELAAEGYGTFEDYYPESAKGTLKASDPYFGRDVIWDGVSGRMIRLTADGARAIEGNIFDKHKLSAVVEGIQIAKSRVVFVAPYGTVTVITLQDVKDSIEYADDDPEGVMTTGDDELDQWLVDPAAVLYDIGYFDLDEVKAYQQDPRGFIKQWSDDPADRKEKRQEMKEAVAEVNRLQEALQYAVDHDEGDLGSFSFQIRDGNHRAFGALLAGEPYVYMIITDNQYQDLDPNNPEDRRILDALE
jgi:GNAT superfamily N-acetyltransferase